MAWTTTHDVDAFLAEAREFLRSRPAEHTVLLTVAETLRARGTAFHGDGRTWFGWWRAASGEVAGALLRTPPRHVLASPLPAAAVAPLAELLAGLDGDAPPGVDLERSAADDFAAAWRARTGRGTATGLRSRLYRLGELAPPRPAPFGRARTATEADRALLTEWVEAFSGETYGQPNRHAAEMVDDLIERRAATLWEDGGAAVAMAGASRLVAGAVRIQAVFTPPAHRRRGYAGAVTATASRRAREAGATEVVLFTDLANPTSNALYQRIGYRPVLDRVQLTFDAP